MASHHIRDIFTTHRMWHTDMGERKESSCFLLPGFTFTNRWALAWEHAPGCYLNEDAGPLQTAQSKEWPSRLHIFTYSRIHDNKVPYPLSGSAIEYLIDRCPNVNHSLSGKYSRHFAFSFFFFFFCRYPFLCLHTLYMQLDRVTGHAHFFGMSVCMCFYFLFKLTSALTASSLLYLASVFLYVMRISRDRSAIQSWAIFHSKETVLIHLLGLKEALCLKYHSLSSILERQSGDSITVMVSVSRRISIDPRDSVLAALVKRKLSAIF